MALQDTIADVVDSAKDLVHIHRENGDHDEKPPIVDALDLLEEDHRKVEALFKEILSEKSSMLTSQRKNIAQVLAELTLHAKIEESIVYPAVFGKTKRDTEERLDVLEAFEEHGSMKELMKKIAKSSGRDESLKAKVQVLSEITEHHVKEEEAELFPEARKLLGEKRLKEIGAQILKIKARAERSKAPKRGAKKSAARKATARKTTGRKK